MYCRPSSPKACDYFLIEDIYGEFTLCLAQRKKVSVKKQQDNPYSSATGPGTESTTISQSITFYYNYTTYSYNEKKGAIIPIFFNLGKTTNKNISVSIEGIDNEKRLLRNKAKYGENNIHFCSKILFEYFLFVELPMFCLVMISAIIWIIYRNLIFGILEIVMTVLIITVKLWYKKKRFFSDETNKIFQSLGRNEKKPVAVKRKFASDADKGICYVSRDSIYPGDVLYLKTGDLLPCDCILLEGECVVNESELNGRTSVVRKVHLENNYNAFVYSENQKSILYQGMKIVKCHSRLEDKSIAVLCINTGTNTLTCNLYLGIHYEIKRSMKILYQNKDSHFIFNFIIFFVSVISLIIIYNMRENTKLSRKFPLHEFILKSVAISLTPTFHLTSSIVLLFTNVNLNNQKIQCVDDSRMGISGKTSTVIFGKTGTLSEESLEISGVYPIYKIGTELCIKTIPKNEIKKLTREYLKYTIEKSNKKGLSNATTYSSNQSILFLECLVTCHNLEKINNENIGNIFDQEIINKAKWDLNSITLKTSLHEEIKTIEIYPKNYYKITEKNAFLRVHNTKQLSFKLQLYQRYYNPSSFNCSSLVLNTYDGSFRFYTKGPPEKILQACISSSIPHGIEKFLTHFRKEGFRIIACATKIVDFKSYTSERTEEFYLNGLTFTGFLTLKNGLKPEAKESIENLKKMSVEVIMCTGDSQFTSLGVAYESKIITDKNVFLFDLDEDGDISITHLYHGEEKSEEPLNNKNNKNNLGSTTNVLGVHNGTLSIIKDNSISMTRINNTQISLMSSERRPILDKSSNVEPTEEKSCFAKANEREKATGDGKSIVKFDEESSKRIQMTGVNGSSSKLMKELSNSVSNFNKISITKYNPKTLNEMKHNSIYCVSGKVFNEMYSNQLKYKKLLKYIRHLAKLYFSMSPKDKKNLIKYYRSANDKTICMVGNNSSDSSALLFSHLGIRSEPPHFSYQRNNCHFFSNVNSLNSVEKIIKNGRAYYENTTILFTFIVISASIESLMNIECFYLQTQMSNIKRVVLDIVIFFLTSLAFRTKANTHKNSDVLFSCGSSFVYFNLVKMLSIFSLKVGTHLFLLFWYKPNPALSKEKGKTTHITYMYLLSVSQIINTLFCFNRVVNFRKNFRNNKILIFFSTIIWFYFLAIILLSNRFLDWFLLKIVEFEESDYELDYYDDRNKLIIFIIIFLDLVLTAIIVEGLKWIFETRARSKINKDKKKIKIN